VADGFERRLKWSAVAAEVFVASWPSMSLTCRWPRRPAGVAKLANVMHGEHQPDCSRVLANTAVKAVFHSVASAADKERCLTAIRHKLRTRSVQVGAQRAHRTRVRARRSRCPCHRRII